MDRDRDSEEAETGTAHVPFATVLASVVGLWLCYFVLTTARGDLLSLGFEQQILWRRGLACLAGIVITLGLWLVLRLFDTTKLWAKITAALLLSLPVALAIAQANRLIFADMEERVFNRVAEQRGFDVHRSGAGDLLVDIPGLALPAVPGAAGSAGSVTIRAEQWLGSSSDQLVELLFSRYFMMLAWCALYLALLAGENARAAERREGAYRRAAKAAELRALRYQVNPHFLFNTLNSLSALVLTGRTQGAERMIQTISTFYRRSLADDPTGDVPLRIDAAQVERIDAERDYVRLYAGDRSHLLLQTIAGLEGRLDPDRFIRIHRSTILRRDRIRGLRHEGLGVWCAELVSGETLRIGRTYLRKVKAMAGR